MRRKLPPVDPEELLSVGLHQFISAHPQLFLYQPVQFLLVCTDPAAKFSEVHPGLQIDMLLQQELFHFLVCFDHAAKFAVRDDKCND